MAKYKRHRKDGMHVQKIMGREMEAKIDRKQGESGKKERLAQKNLEVIRENMCKLKTAGF